MKKVISLILVLGILLTVLTGCSSKTCDMCGKNYRGDSYDLSHLGRGHVCRDCYMQMTGHAGNATSPNTGKKTSKPGEPLSTVEDAEEALAASFYYSSSFFDSPCIDHSVKIDSHSWKKGNTQDNIQLSVVRRFPNFAETIKMNWEVPWDETAGIWGTGHVYETSRTYDLSPLNGEWEVNYKHVMLGNDAQKLKVTISNAGDISENSSGTITIHTNFNELWASKPEIRSEGGKIEFEHVSKAGIHFEGKLPVEGGFITPYINITIYEDSVVLENTGIGKFGTMKKVR